MSYGSVGIVPFVLRCHEVIFVIMSTMNKLVIAITGPSGAGKSTVGERVAKSLERCVNIDADHVKHMVVSGFYKDSKNPAGWSFNEWALVGESIGMLAANFLRNNFSVVINGYIDEPAWHAIEAQVKIDHKFLLLPNLDVVTNRDKGRREDIRMGAASVKEHHKTFSTDPFYVAFQKLDTSNHSIEQTVTEIIKCLN